DVIQLAKQKVGVQQKKVDHLLVDLEREKKKVFEAKVEFEKKTKHLSKIQEENETLQLFLADNKKALLKQAKEEAQEILKNANKLIENTISEIKETKADKEVTKNLRRKLNEEREKNLVSKETSLPQGKNEVIEVGDWVRIVDTDTVAQVMEIAKDNVILAMGDLRSVVKRKRIEKTAKVV